MLKPKIAILGAMGEETHLLEKAIAAPEIRRIAGRDFYLGYLAQVPVVVGFSKWGKVAAALSATLAIQVFDVDQILFLGVAGSLDDQVRQGDVVIGSHCLQHDMDVSALPDYKRWTVPLLKVERFESQPEKVRLLREISTRYLSGRQVNPHLKRQVHIGLLGTGDSFMADTAKKRALKQDLPDLLAVDMESAAVAQVCYEFNRPFNVVRIISDSADDSAVADFQQFIHEQAAPAVKEIAVEYLRRMTA